MRLVEEDVPRIEICVSDTWVSLQESSLRTSKETSVIGTLEGAALESSGIALRWDNTAQDVSISEYDITCSGDDFASSLRVGGGFEAAVLSGLVPDTDYQCCVEASLDAAIFDLVEVVSTECVSVRTGALTGSQTSAGVAGLSIVTYGLGGLVGLLIVALVVVALSCVCIMLSKRKHQVRYVRMPGSMCSRRDHRLVLNPLKFTHTYVWLTQSSVSLRIAVIL